MLCYNLKKIKKGSFFMAAGFVYFCKTGFWQSIEAIQGLPTGGAQFKAAAKFAAVLTAKGTFNTISSIASKALAPVAVVAAYFAMPVLYTWKPVHVVVNKAVAPLAEKTVQAAGWSVPQPIQALCSFLAYEKLKDQFFSAQLDLKKAVVFSTVALYASQDPAVQRAARSAMTTTVWGTIGACAAFDCANYAIREWRRKKAEASTPFSHRRTDKQHSKTRPAVRFPVSSSLPPKAAPAA